MHGELRPDILQRRLRELVLIAGAATPHLVAILDHELVRRRPHLDDLRRRPVVEHGEGIDEREEVWVEVPEVAPRCRVEKRRRKLQDDLRPRVRERPEGGARAQGPVDARSHDGRDDLERLVPVIERGRIDHVRGADRAAQIVERAVGLLLAHVGVGGEVLEEERRAARVARHVEARFRRAREHGVDASDAERCHGVLTGRCGPNATRGRRWHSGLRSPRRSPVRRTMSA